MRPEVRLKLDVPSRMVGWSCHLSMLLQDMWLFAVHSAWVFTDEIWRSVINLLNEKLSREDSSVLFEHCWFYKVISQHDCGSCEAKVHSVWPPFDPFKQVVSMISLRGRVFRKNKKYSILFLRLMHCNWSLAVTLEVEQVISACKGQRLKVLSSMWKCPLVEVWSPNCSQWVFFFFVFFNLSVRDIVVVAPAGWWGIWGDPCIKVVLLLIME